ncbi:competence protein ComEA [Paenibacillus sp. V4I3]|uniref:helix-hairpin-helix domain-containing protein n=1 Tax=Paenibacillus sp. V4I3 TaxID=3042305 RepID=UPI002787645F|nr:helix-hairpin-helix domain-containing protein [Paenibacillus sp. V4I3]MDQ0876993.1 competence protein ComEA [Paenibacillus sp. V4I3]
MDFFGSKRGRILLMMAAICLFAFVAWPFLRGGRSMIQTDFMPLNTQMQAMISQTGEESLHEAKLTGKLDSKTTIDEEPKATRDTEPKTTTDTEPNATIDTEPKSAIPAPMAMPTPSVVSNEKPEASLPAARSTGQLDLNTATLKQLDEIPGIGESKARAILDYRLKKGRFSRIEELIEVKGIGEKMLEKLKVFLYVTTS